MANESPNVPASKAVRWTGFALSFLPAAMLIFGSVVAIISSPQTQDNMAQMGYPASTGRPIGIVLLVSTILYIVPQTAVLGAILLTGYLGGAVATHVRVQDGNFYFAVIFGVLLWLGIFLRDSRLRVLIPLRKL